jgi:ubiquitin-conjugating enzyme E2 S
MVSPHIQRWNMPSFDAKAIAQNSRALRRLAADHAALHYQPLPPNYLFAPNASDNDDLTQLDVLLVGPSHTPFSAGIFKLHLTIPPTYPQQPPTAHFRTPIFHPNVDPQTGGVCVETLKRDWDAKLTLRDILIVISCLLIQPNPDSALNAEAGQLIQEEYKAFAKRARMMSGIHAVIPRNLKEAAREAQTRGQEQEQSQPFVRHNDADDVFEEVTTPPRRRKAPARNDDDSSIADVDDQENDEARSPVKSRTPRAATPRRPQGAPVPLGELTLDDVLTDSDSDMEAEYPPSPRKSPTKSCPRKQRPQPDEPSERPESSRDALRRAPNVTPPSNPFIKPLAQDSPFATTMTDLTPSPRKAKVGRPTTTPEKPLFKRPFYTPKKGEKYTGIFKPRTPTASEKKRLEDKRKAALNERLWKLCGGDVERWNRGDFDGAPFKVKAGRW